MISVVHEMPHSFFAGMDWKSMTMPASLPITTDYFPDKRSLQIDYVLSEYNMEPVVVNAELGERYVNVFHLKTSFCLDRIFNFLQCMHNYFCQVLWLRAAAFVAATALQWDGPSENSAGFSAGHPQQETDTRKRLHPNHQHYQRKRKTCTTGREYFNANI